MQKIIKIEKGVTRMPEWRMAEPVDFELCDGEHMAIVGPNGGGKSMLVDILIGRHPLIMTEPQYDFAPSTKPLAADNIKYITFRDSYGDSDGTYFLQQRWNQQEIDEETPRVGSELEKAYHMAGEDTPERRQLQSHLYRLFHIEHLMDKYLILMSSGELRKYQLTKALLTDPRVLIMDNPFIGLDAETRDQLKELLTALARERQLQVILVLSKTDDIPDFITHVVEVRGMRVGTKMTREEYISSREPNPARVLDDEMEQAIVNLPYKDNDYNSEEVVGMNKVSIVYGERTILKELDWTVRNGERWALSGQNGAGKSTLLSLVCADNPQSYACDIALFGNPRGSGESIWDIKKRIGYVSPEMHLYYRQNVSALQIVGSGFFDSIGLYRTCSAEQEELALAWMRLFGMDHLRDRMFQTLSSGEQRLVLLARAFVKDPDLIILDEPLHGLDVSHKKQAAAIIERFCERPGKTLIYVTHYPHELPTCVDKQFELVKR